MLTMYGVLGGTPRYHALVDTERPFGEEIVDLLLRPRGALEGEVSFLLGSEQIRDPSPYNAVLSAIAGGYVFGECKWSRNTPVGMNVYARLLSKVEMLPEARHRKDPTLVLFSLGGFLPEVIACAASPQNRLHLVGPETLLPQAFVVS